MMVHYDNQAVVEVLKSGKYAEQMQLLCCLFFITAHLELVLTTMHIPEHLNTWADTILQNNTNLFLAQVLGANRTPCPIPLPLMDFLVNQRPDWTSWAWSQLFGSCLKP